MTARHGAVFLVFLLLATSAAPAQTARTGQVMREKLGHAQQVLKALTTSDYALLDSESAALARIAASPRWDDLKTRELRVYTDSFLKTVADLAAAAKRRDLDAAAVQYTTMVTACYQCHRRLKDLRIAR